MKIFVKTLKGIRFEIEVKPGDTVADVKKNIETVKGGVYPADRQMLIHRGAVLKDGTTLEENKVAENSFVVIILTGPQRSNVPVVTTQFSDAQAPAPPQPATATPGSEPVGVSIPSVTEGNEPTITPPAQRPEAAQPSTVLPSGGPNTIPLNLSPQFHRLRARVQENPQIMLPVIQIMLHELGRQMPQLARFIQEYQGEYLRLLSEPQEGGNGNEIPNQLDGGGALPQELTPEEQEAVGRLEAMGFDRAIVLEAFIACNKDVELTANYLIMNHSHEE